MENDPLTPEQPAENQPAGEPQPEAPSQGPKLPDPRRRLRELLAVPERDRSDAVWDEIIELEIQLAPGNRASSQPSHGGRMPEAGRGQEGGRRPGMPQQQQDRSFGAKPAKRFSKQPKHRPGRRTRPPG